MTWEPQVESDYRWRGIGERANGATNVLSRLQPAEGWGTVPLVVLLCMVVAWSISDARWVLGADKYTGFLIWVAFIASLWGWVSARLISRRWLAHLLGAVLAGFVLPVLVGYAIAPAAHNPVDAFKATGTAVMKAYLDLVWNRLLTTQQVGHFSMFLGILIWSTSQAASYNVFGHRRPVNAVLLLAVVLVGNMALTIQDQFFALVLFSIVALALLLQTHAADERTAWLRHRIWRQHESTTPHFRTGAAFAGIAVSLSLVFTTVAASAPLADAWPGIANNFQEVADWVVRYLPQSGNSRINPPGDFPATTVIASQWKPQDELVFSVRGSDAATNFHWRMISYDYFNKTGWQIGPDQSKVTVGSGSPIEGGTQDEVTEQGRVQRQLSVTLIDKSVRQLIVPNEAVSVSVDVDMNRIGTSSALAHTSYGTTSSSSYVVTALVPSLDRSGSGVTENKLRAAGVAYPAGLKTTYTQGADQVGSDGRQLLQTILATLSPDQNTPYDIAKAVQDYLRDGSNFTYDADITPYLGQCSDVSTVDCFARIKRGFCQQYATTMTMLLRMEGIPARYVQGYLPGSVDPRTFIQNVSRKNQHAWVEVYFPGYGWIEFDPTGSVGQPAKIPAGPVVKPTPTPSIAPQDSESANRTKAPRPSSSGAAGPTGTSGGLDTRILAGVLIAIAIVVLIGLLLFRRARRIESPDAVYRGIARMASWLGYRPQPTQTVYEYIGTLETAMPRSRPHLEAVAAAKVEVTYGRRVLGDDRLRGLVTARNRLRIAFMRLAVRRPPIPVPFRGRRKRRK